MMKRFRGYIENSTWDEILENDGLLLNRICWCVLGAAASYFGWIALSVLIRGPQ